MSTRAIVGYMLPNGTIVGGWQWYDGGNLQTQLRNNFKTKEEVNTLINQGVWRCLVTPRDSILEWYQEKCKKDPTSYHLIPVNKSWVFKYSAIDNLEHFYESIAKGHEQEIKIKDNVLIFKNIACAFGQDLTYVYLFNEKTSKWNTFGNRYTYQFFEDFCKKTPSEEHYKLLKY